MKSLIVSGDSNADKRFRSACYPALDTSWPKWPELLGEKLNMKTFNTALGGAGNEYIFSRLQAAIMNTEDKSQIGLVVAGWSQCHRLDWQNEHDNTVFGWKNQRVAEHGNLIGWMRKTLRYQLALKVMCDAFDIPYIQFQIIHPYSSFIEGLQPTEDQIMFGGKKMNVDREEYPGDKSEDLKKLVSVILAYDKHLGQDGKFIGWPVSNRYHALRSKIDKDGNDLGFDVLTKLWWAGVTRDERLKYIIDELDVHPNAKGQERIADFLEKEIEKIYGKKNITS